MNDIDKQKIGEKIARARKAAGKTQENVAEKLGVSFQAVSLWERGVTFPETENLIMLADYLGVSVSSLVEERGGYVFTTHKNLFDWKHMAAFVKHTARAKGFHESLKALDFATKAHEGQFRKNAPDIPYIYHPLNLACHCFALGVADDALISACLLHDVVEDTPYTLADLPVSIPWRICRSLTKLKSWSDC